MRAQMRGGCSKPPDSAQPAADGSAEIELDADDGSVLDLGNDATESGLLSPEQVAAHRLVTELAGGADVGDRPLPPDPLEDVGDGTRHRPGHLVHQASTGQFDLDEVVRFDGLEVDPLRPADVGICRDHLSSGTAGDPDVADVELHLVALDVSWRHHENVHRIARDPDALDHGEVLRDAAIAGDLHPRVDGDLPGAGIPFRRDAHLP